MTKEIAQKIIASRQILRDEFHKLEALVTDLRNQTATSEDEEEALDQTDSFEEEAVELGGVCSGLDTLAGRLGALTEDFNK